MNFIKTIALAVMALALASLTASAAVGFSSFATSGTAVNLGTNYAIIPSQSINGGDPVVNFLSVRGLSSAAITLTSYLTTNKTTITATNTPGLTRTNIVGSTNSFTVGMPVIVQHLQLPYRFQYEKLVVGSFQNTNQIVFDTAPVSTIAIGDVVYQEIAGASISVVSSTTPLTITGTGIFSGQRATPFLFQITSTAVSTNTIDAINAIPIP